MADKKNVTKKMKKRLFLSSVLLVFLACKNNPKTEESVDNKDLPQNEIHKEFYGTWVGNFTIPEDEEFDEMDPNVVGKLNLVIKRITPDTVIAQSIVAGNIQSLSGKITENGSKASFVLDQPGGDKLNGRFEFEFKNDTLKGIWIPYKKSLETPKKEYKLLKKTFLYNPNLMLDTENNYVDWTAGKDKENIIKNDDGTIDTAVNTFYRAASDKIFKLNASNTVLKEKDVKNLRKLDLEIIKNTIFARHGYAFKKQLYRNFFDPNEWYVPVSDNVDKELTDLERQNIQLLQRFEKYAKDSYETFGR